MTTTGHFMNGSSAFQPASNTQYTYRSEQERIETINVPTSTSTGTSSSTTFETVSGSSQDRNDQNNVQNVKFHVTTIVKPHSNQHIANTNDGQAFATSSVENSQGQSTAANAKIYRNEIHYVPINANNSGRQSRATSPINPPSQVQSRATSPTNPPSQSGTQHASSSAQTATLPLSPSSAFAPFTSQPPVPEQQSASGYFVSATQASTSTEAKVPISPSATRAQTAPLTPRISQQQNNLGYFVSTPVASPSKEAPGRISPSATSSSQTAAVKPSPLAMPDISQQQTLQQQNDLGSFVAAPLTSPSTGAQVPLSSSATFNSQTANQGILVTTPVPSSSKEASKTGRTTPPAPSGVPVRAPSPVLQSPTTMATTMVTTTMATNGSPSQTTVRTTSPIRSTTLLLPSSLDAPPVPIAQQRASSPPVQLITTVGPQFTTTVGPQFTTTAGPQSTPRTPIAQRRNSLGREQPLLTHTASTIVPSQGVSNPADSFQYISPVSSPGSSTVESIVLKRDQHQRPDSISAYTRSSATNTPGQLISPERLPAELLQRLNGMQGQARPGVLSPIAGPQVPPVNGDPARIPPNGAINVNTHGFSAPTNMPKKRPHCRHTSSSSSSSSASRSSEFSLPSSATRHGGHGGHEGQGGSGYNYVTYLEQPPQAEPSPFGFAPPSSLLAQPDEVALSNYIIAIQDHINRVKAHIEELRTSLVECQNTLQSQSVPVVVFEEPLGSEASHQAILVQ